MAVGPLHGWIANEILTAADLVNEFANIYNNGQLIGFPRTVTADFNGETLILGPGAGTTWSAPTDDEVVLAIDGTDTYSFTGTRIEILGRRVLTTADRVKLLAGTASLFQVNTVAARVTSLESDAVTMAQLNNF